MLDSREYILFSGVQHFQKITLNSKLHAKHYSYVQAYQESDMSTSTCRIVVPLSNFVRYYLQFRATIKYDDFVAKAFVLEIDANSTKSRKLSCQVK
jgi:hypothetical protein